ncbi:hypothetical protein CXB51_001169 [Gossypium anomalum]|uniref:Uncharacterized protein ycf72 n=1 Tax=Gossypium anomalum TaxID=47600 RepID=A0A8J5ZQW1_9ROSI|nr:hypothetical protein CXB51_001169 [Gossypium anomalum]
MKDRKRDFESNRISAREILREYEKCVKTLQNDGLTTRRLPSQHLDPALPKLFWFTLTFPTCPTIAEQFLDIKWTSLEGNFKMTDLPSFAISFATAPAALVNCPPLPSVISMLCMVVPKGISVTVDSFFDRSIKTPSQTVQVSSKAYGFLDVDDDIYTDGFISFLSTSVPKTMVSPIIAPLGCKIYLFSPCPLCMRQMYAFRLGSYSMVTILPYMSFLFCRKSILQNRRL